MFQTLFLWRRVRRPAPRRPAPEPLPDWMADEPAPEEEAPGCGWFDSSADLKSGLSVTEHASAERLAAALPLDDWIAFHLASGGGGARLQSGNAIAPH